MSEFELKDGQGTLFINDKGDNDKRPDRRGQIKIGGKVYQLAGWLKQGKKGPWLSLSAQLEDESPTRNVQTHGKHIDPDADIPF